jgi:hypothetical protein
MQGPCHEANADQAAFVQGAIIDPATGAISIYNPLVIDRGTQAAAQPVMPQLPQGAIVGLWFGFNGDVLQLRGNLAGGMCVNGSRGSNFGQFADCNAAAFFQAANTAIQAGQLTPPPLGTARDGQTCMSVRDFGLVDMDQSDNVTTTYLVTADGRVAQMTAVNTAALKNAQVSVNGSDNRLLDVAVDTALGCQPWTAPDLANSGQMVPALPLNELQAAAHQAAPVATIPAGDPMVLGNNGSPNLNKLNAFRIGVNQAAVNSLNDAAVNTMTYCTNLVRIGTMRTRIDQRFTQNAPSPDPAAANNLFTFLAQRLSTAIGADGLNCLGMLNIQNPITLTTDANGVVTNATISRKTIPI